MRVVETTRRHPGRATVVTGTVVLERGLGGAATVALGAVGFLLSIGEYDVSAYLWLEGVFVFGTLVLGFLFFARSARPLLRRTQPLLERIRLERPVRHFYEGVHHYRGHPRLLGKVLARHARRAGGADPVDLGVRRRRSGIELDPRIYYVFGPLLFLVMLVPFTLNGHRRARGVLRELPRQRRRRREPGVRRGLPVLPRDAAHGVARAR